MSVCTGVADPVQAHVAVLSDYGPDSVPHSVVLEVPRCTRSVIHCREVGNSVSVCVCVVVCMLMCEYLLPVVFLAHTHWCHAH